MNLFLSLVILSSFFVSVWVFIVVNKNQENMPSLTGWLILTWASVLNLLTFFIYKGWTYENFISGIMYIGNVSGIFFIIIFLLLQKNKNLTLNGKDKFMLAGSAFATVFWFISRNHFWANICIQIIMVSGYLFFINAMYKIKKRLDSFIFWILAFLGSVLSFPLVKGNLLAEINTWRSVISVAIVLLVMSYYEFFKPNKQERQNDVIL